MNSDFLDANRGFMECFAKSVQRKDWGMLRSALNLRREATGLVRHDPGLYALGKANEAVLLFHHIGNGLEAYAAATECMKNIEAMAQVDKDWQSCAGFSLLHDCFGPALFLSSSYEEAERHCELACTYDFGNKETKTNLNNIRKVRASGKPWWEAQFMGAQQFYSRSTPSRDAGKHAAAMSILHFIISRACDEKHGYEIETDRLFDILDDYIALPLRLYDIIIMKFVTELKKNNPIVEHANGVDEQFIIFEEPVRYWLELMPDCPEKWKKTFKQHYELYMQSPFPICPEAMAKIGAYFSDVKVATKKCEQCGHANSSISPICVKCNHRFSSPVPQPKGKMPVGCLVPVMLVWLGTAGFYWYSALVTKSHGTWAWAFATVCSLLFLNSLFFFLKGKRK